MHGHRGILMTTHAFVFDVAKVDGQGYAAVRTEEPVFCFVRPTEDAAIEVAKETLADYCHRFQGSASGGSVKRLPDLRVLRLSASRAVRLQVA